MRSFREVSEQYSELLRQSAGRANSTGEIDLATQIEVNRLCSMIQTIGKQKTKEVVKVKTLDRQTRPYRKRQVTDKQVIIARS
jgi:hypothetical protein